MVNREEIRYIKVIPFDNMYLSLLFIYIILVENFPSSLLLPPGIVRFTFHFTFVKVKNSEKYI